MISKLEWKKADFHLTLIISMYGIIELLKWNIIYVRNSENSNNSFERYKTSKYNKRKMEIE